VGGTVVPWINRSKKTNNLRKIENGGSTAAPLHRPATLHPSCSKGGSWPSSWTTPPCNFPRGKEYMPQRKALSPPQRKSRLIVRRADGRGTTFRRLFGTVEVKRGCDRKRLRPSQNRKNPRGIFGKRRQSRRAQSAIAQAKKKKTRDTKWETREGVKRHRNSKGPSKNHRKNSPDPKKKSWKNKGRPSPDPSRPKEPEFLSESLESR